MTRTVVRPALAQRTFMLEPDMFEHRARRRVVLIERDNQQHLILLGQHNDLVIEQNISLDAEDLKNIEQGKERAA